MVTPTPVNTPRNTPRNSITIENKLIQKTKKMLIIETEEKMIKPIWLKYDK